MNRYPKVVLPWEECPDEPVSQSTKILPRCDGCRALLDSVYAGAGNAECLSCLMRKGESPKPPTWWRRRVIAAQKRES